MKSAHWLWFPFGMTACMGQVSDGSETDELPASAVLAVAPPDVGEPLAGLSAAQEGAFEEGLDAFSEEETEADGLGPVFNGRSCAGCHSAPAIGGSGTVLETRFGLVSGGTFDPLLELGGSLIQTTGTTAVSAACPVAAVPGETVPPSANVVARRRTTPLFGLGLVDNVPDDTFRTLANQQTNDPDGVSGRVNTVLEVATNRTRVGKFGWKAQVPTLAQFAADAYLNEMGITSPLFPLETCPQGDCSLRVCDRVPDPDDDGSDVEAFTNFMSLLAPPRRRGDEAAGENSFGHIGCQTCHVAVLKTGSSPVAALDRVTFHPFSDFLLHDMGALGDGIVQGDAAQREMRTAPLWGVSRQPTLLHDGRTTSLEQAILAHDGEAKKASDRFAQLTRKERDRILAFLKTL